MQKYISDKKFLWIMSLGVIVYFQMSWVPGFFQDGYLYAAFGKNAAELGHWLVPHLSDSTYPRFFHHTNFVFILEGIFFKIFGASFITARIFAGLFSLLTGVYVFRFLKGLKLNHLAYLSLLIFYLIPPLMKKSRFPNIDLPLMLFFTVAMCNYWKAYLNGSWKSWLMCGVFFGLSALTKGPMALWIPIIIILHLAFKKSLTKLYDRRPWLSLLLGLCLFSIWPLSLKLSGNFDIFENWFKFTFLHTIIESRGEGSPFYTYFVFLLQNVNLWFIGCIVGVYFSFKNKQDEFLILSSIIFLVVLISLSVMSFKYSNYLIPIYPFLSVLSAYGIHRVIPKWSERILKFFRVLTPIAALTLLIFPITNTSKRDPELFKAREVLNYIGFSPKNWVNYKDAYPYWSLANLNGYLDQSNTFNSEDVSDMNSVVLVKSHDLVNAFENMYIKENFKKAFFFRKKKIYLLVPKVVSFGQMKF